MITEQQIELLCLYTILKDREQALKFLDEMGTYDFEKIRFRYNELLLQFLTPYKRTTEPKG